METRFAVLAVKLHWLIPPTSFRQTIEASNHQFNNLLFPSPNSGKGQGVVDTRRLEIKKTIYSRIVYCSHGFWGLLYTRP